MRRKKLSRAFITIYRYANEKILSWEDKIYKIYILYLIALIWLQF